MPGTKETGEEGERGPGPLGLADDRPWKTAGWETVPICQIQRAQSGGSNGGKKKESSRDRERLSVLLTKGSPARSAIVQKRVK